MRSIFKFFGNTTLLNYLSVGKEFRQWCTDQQDYKDLAFRGCGRCDLGNCQDGIAEHCFNMELRVEAILAFITEFHWDDKDCNY